VLLRDFDTLWLHNLYRKVATKTLSHEVSQRVSVINKQIYHMVKLSAFLLNYPIIKKLITYQKTQTPNEINSPCPFVLLRGIETLWLHNLYRKVTTKTLSHEFSQRVSVINKQIYHMVKRFKFLLKYPAITI